jgi:peptidyl-dipeptidase A
MLWVAGASLAVGFGLWTVVTGAGISQEDFKTFVKDYEAKAIPLSRERNLAYFNASISGQDADYQKYDERELEYRILHSDPATFARINAFQEGGQVTDPVLHRELEMLYLKYQGNQIDKKLLQQITNLETAVEQKFNTFRTEVGDRRLPDNDVDSILRVSTDSRELEAVWKASKEIGRVVEADVRQLAKLRNQAARSLGFRDFFEMELKLSEIEPADLDALFTELDSLTRGGFAELKWDMDSALSARLGISKHQLRPWHYQNRFFQEAPSIYGVDLNSFYEGKDPVEIARKYFTGIGLKIDTILAHSDLYEKPGKYQHAYSTDIDRHGDSRVVCSIRPDSYWMGTLLHELGHATYTCYYDSKLPWLLREEAHSFTTEGVAEFLESLTANPQWLVEVVGAKKEEVDKVRAACAQSQRAGILIFSRWSQVVVSFERGLYSNPDQDLNKLWWDLVEKYQLLPRPEGRNEPDWASKIHIATSPVYYHCYQMGYLLASQYADAIGRAVFGSADPYNLSFANDQRIGKYFMDKVYGPGSLHPWNEMIERATGQKLTSAFYARQYVGKRQADGGRPPGK